MTSVDIETFWQKSIDPEIEKFNKISLFPSTLVKLRAQKVIENISWPEVAVDRLFFDTNRLIRKCHQKDPFSIISPLIVNSYPFSAQFIILAERNLRIPKYATLFAEEVMGVMKDKLSIEIRDGYQVELDELTDFLIKDPTGFQIVDIIASDADQIERRTILPYGNIINQIITQGAERYKFIYNQLVLPQTDKMNPKM